MKATTFLLFGAFIIMGFLWQQSLKENKYLKGEILKCDSINKVNKKTLDSLIMSNKNYSDQFNRLFDSVRKMRK